MRENHFRLLNKGWQTTAHRLNPATLICSGYPHCSHPAMVKWKSCDRHHMVHKAWNIYYLVLCGKTLLISDLEKFSLVPGTPRFRIPSVVVVVVFSGGEEIHSWWEEWEEFPVLSGEGGYTLESMTSGQLRQSLEEEEGIGSSESDQESTSFVLPHLTHPQP